MSKLDVMVLDDEIEKIANFSNTNLEKLFSDYVHSHEDIKFKMDNNELSVDQVMSYAIIDLTKGFFNQAAQNLYEKGSHQTIQTLTMPIENYVDYVIGNILNLYGEDNSKMFNQYLTNLNQLEVLPASVTFQYDYSFVENEAIVGKLVIKNYDEFKPVEEVENQILRQIVRTESLKDIPLNEQNPATLDIIQKGIDNFIELKSGEQILYASNAQEFIKKFNYCSEIITQGEKQTVAQAQVEFNQHLSSETNELKTNLFKKIKP